MKSPSAGFESGLCAFAGRRKPLHFIEQVKRNEYDAKITSCILSHAKAHNSATKQPPKQPRESE
jgi:hypothetical protein